MTRTIIGVFNSFDRANAAMANLASKGLSDAQHMHVSTNDKGYGYEGETTAGGTVVAPAYREDATGETLHTGVLASIENFFSNLFGSSVPPMPAAHYQEVVNRGSALLAVDVEDETQLQTVELALERAGAVDINGRVPSWQKEGYIDADRASAPLITDLAPQQRDSIGQGEIDGGLSGKFDRK